MLSSLKLLAAAVDELTAQRRATVTETGASLTIAGLLATEALQLVPLLDAVGWSFQIVDDAGEFAEAGTLNSFYEPFVVTLEKPVRDNTLRVVTQAGFESFLIGESTDIFWEIVSLEKPFATMATSFLPWGHSEIFSVAAETKSPRDLVRDYNYPAKVPKDIRFWTLRDLVTQSYWEMPVFQKFLNLSAQELMKAVAREIKADGDLVFKGMTTAHINAPHSGTIGELGIEGYNDLQSAVLWVYENKNEAEQRHGIFIAEFGNNYRSEEAAGVAFRSIVSTALEGARLAYQLSLSDLTREAIKAQGDLRKVVADDTAKLSDNSRQVITSVAAAIATCIGLLAARVGADTPHWVLQVIVIIVCIYVFSIIVSGWIFMNVQRDMREKWRTRLYRFIPDQDYHAMVTGPAKRAERMFYVTAWCGLSIAIMAAVVLSLFSANVTVKSSDELCFGGYVWLKGFEKTEQKCN